MTRAFSVVALLGLGGCPGEGGPDAGSNDSGRGPDGCAIDAPIRDGGINLGPCNPADGTRCEISAGKSCVWDPRLDEGECRCLETPHAFGESCGNLLAMPVIPLRDCAPGLACIQIGNEPDAKCYQVCDLGTSAQCDPLTTPTLGYACLPLNRVNTGLTVKNGLCAPIGQPCDPLNDTCTPDETCSLVTVALAVCQEQGPVPIGGDCSVDQCQKGGLCVPLVDPNGNPIGTMCYEPCDRNSPSCTAGMCTDVGLDPIGLCL